MTKTQSYKILFLTLFWVSCLLFLLLFEGVVTGYKPITPEAIPMDFSVLVLVLLISLVGASLTATFEVLIFSRLFRKKPFGTTLLYKTSFYLFNMLFWFSLIELITTNSPVISKLSVMWI